MSKKDSDRCYIIGELKKHIKYLKDEQVDMIMDSDDLYLEANKDKPEAEIRTALPASDGLTSEEELYRLRLQIGDCKRCNLHLSRTSIVFGEGNTNPDIVLVGEGPGVNEDKQGRPFVGAAGKLLNRIILAMGLTRDELYICNVVKCHPPNNRDPESDETNVCGRFLAEQIKILQPKIIVALGRVSGRYLTNSPSQTSLNSLRKQIFKFQGFDLAVTYHPSALLRNPAYRRPVWEDVQMVMNHIGRPINSPDS